MKKFVETNNHRIICEAIDNQARFDGDFRPIIVISGNFGSGKTESLNHLAAQEGYFLVTCYKGIAHRALLCRIAESMELVPKGTIAQLTEQIIQYWEESQTPMLVDEADFIITGDLVEVVRCLADEANAPLCLSGMGRFEKLLKEYPHVLDRSPEPEFRVRLHPLTVKELKNIVSELSAVKWESSAIQFLHSKERGRYRGTMWSISKVDQMARRNGVEVVDQYILEEML